MNSSFWDDRDALWKVENVIEKHQWHKKVLGKSKGQVMFWMFFPILNCLAFYIML